MSDVTDSQIRSKGNSIVTSLHNIRQVLFDKGVLTDQEAFGLRNVTSEIRSEATITDNILSKRVDSAGDPFTPALTKLGLQELIRDAVTISYTTTDFNSDPETREDYRSGFMADIGVDAEYLRYNIPGIAKEIMYSDTAHLVENPLRTKFYNVKTGQYFEEETMFSGASITPNLLPSVEITAWRYSMSRNSTRNTQMSYTVRVRGQDQFWGTARYDSSANTYKNTIPLYSEYDPQIEFMRMKSLEELLQEHTFQAGVYYVERWLRVHIGILLYNLRRSRVGIVPLDQLAGKIRAAIPDPAT